MMMIRVEINEVTVEAEVDADYHPEVFETMLNGLSKQASETYEKQITFGVAMGFADEDEEQEEEEVPEEETAAPED